MDISFNDLRSKEIINLCDGSKMGHIVDLIFSSENGRVTGIVAPGEKKLFKKSEEIFVPIEKVRRIGDDVILIRYEINDLNYKNYVSIEKNGGGNSVKVYQNSSKGQGLSFIRYRKLDNKKYK